MHFSFVPKHHLREKRAFAETYIVPLILTFIQVAHFNMSYDKITLFLAG